MGTKPGGNRRDYLLSRLRREGLDDLVAAVEDGVITPFEVAVALGWRRRPEPLGTGSENQARRRAFRLGRLGLVDGEEPSWP